MIHVSCVFVSQRKDQVLSSFKPLQRTIALCMTCPNLKVVRAVHALLTRLMSLFPTEPASSSVASKHEELENLYAHVGKVVYEGLSSFEKYVQTSKVANTGKNFVSQLKFINLLISGTRLRQRRSSTQRS